MEFCLPRFDRDTVADNAAFGAERPCLGLWEWQANCMENYVIYLIDHHALKPKYYCPHDSVNLIAFCLTTFAVSMV
eukprot:CAMPEP_0168239432 /NCGR_PEP_ID=MMETSP0140_2-20121125/21515_1 /TAXON_ID=44445 /ORGANISM="Pseudo-nitzschia australis, Strain 10249 10 AB" /LENGTH=75 /DNA_ID=CAMNT_0008173729 /DNA_START=1 /DNA_END=225 /DNA_ORIENTATION=+